MTDYEKSNKYDSVALNKFSHKEWHDLLECGESFAERRDAGQRLLDYLCKKFKICSVSLSTTHKIQEHRDNSNGTLRAKVLGKYYPQMRAIVVYNLTAKRKKVVSIKTFADTLLHEFMHHYDHVYLKMNDSPHTTGFYKRISDLKAKLN